MLKKLEETLDKNKRFEIAAPLLNGLKTYGAFRTTYNDSQGHISNALNTTARVLNQSKDDLQKYIEGNTTINMYRGLQIKHPEGTRIYATGANHNISFKDQPDLYENSAKVFEDFTAVSEKLMKILGLLYENNAKGVLYHTVLEKDARTQKPSLYQSLLWLIHYPTLEQIKQEGLRKDNNFKIRQDISNHPTLLEAHQDYSYFTVLSYAKTKGLFIMPHNVALNRKVRTKFDAVKVPLNQWIPAAGQPGELLVQLGLKAQIATQNTENPLQATWHIVLGDYNLPKQTRTSAALFVQSTDKPVPDLNNLKDNGEGFETARFQFTDNSQEFAVTSQPKLMIEKWNAQNDPRAKQHDEQALINQVNNIETTAQEIVNKNTSLSYNA